MPIIMASAVISTGRMRVAPGIERGLMESRPSPIRWRANDTIKMLFAVATPMVMMAPVIAGTLKVVPREEQHPADAGQGRRQRRDDDEGVDPGLEIDDNQQIHHDNRHHEAHAQLTNEAHMVCAWPRTAIRRAARQLRAQGIDQGLDFIGNAAQVPALHADVDIDSRGQVIARDHRQLCRRRHAHEIAQQLRAARCGPRTGVRSSASRLST